MRTLLATCSLVLLAACAGGGGDEGRDDTEATAGEESDAGDSGDAASAGADDPRRADMIAECIDDVRPEVPPGTDLDGFCGCAVGEMEGGAEERDAMENCAADMGIEPQS